jgi:uncharacterized membrane protein YcaP (DUF421 family)
MDHLITNQYLNVALRSIAVYLFILFAIRLTGKKELSQLNTSDVVLILLISNAVQNAMIGANTSLSAGLMAAGVLFVANYGLHDLISDKPEILIHNGILDAANLNKLGIDDDEIKESMREHGVEKLADVKLAMLEIDGNISVISEKNGQLTQTHYKRRKQHKTLGSNN